jgi:hypothetical protein
MVSRDQVRMALATPGNIRFPAVDDLLGSRRLGRWTAWSRGLMVNRDQGTEEQQQPGSSWSLDEVGTSVPSLIEPPLTWGPSPSRDHQHLGTKSLQGSSRPRFPALLVARTPGIQMRQGTMIVKDPRFIGPWFTLGSSLMIDQGIELMSPSWCSIQHQRLGSKKPRDTRCFAGLGGPGHWLTKFLAVNGCHGTRKPSSMNDQSRPGTHPVDGPEVAWSEQELGGMGSWDPWQRRRMGCRGPGQLGHWVPAGAWSLGRRST